ncbi:bpX6 domain-containing protein [Pendulispora albinea]|uniref:Protein phosphatase 2C domain-containing protein n=1 Tax=Pendulispora albinea TaxID=2741071 RepID=A0ABZ2LU47_9BACT
MTEPCRPRRLVHRGSILASGFVLSTRVVGEDAARARILRLEGADVFRVDHLLVVRLRTEARVHCDSSLGAPLVRYGQLHSPAPLEPDEVAMLRGAPLGDGGDRRAEAVVRIAGGLAAVVALEAGLREDVAQWLDVSAFAVVTETIALGAVAMSPTAMVPAPSGDLRTPLGVSSLPARGASLVADLATRARAGETGASGASGTSGPSGAKRSISRRSAGAMGNGAASHVLGALLRLVRWMGLGLQALAWIAGGSAGAGTSGAARARGWLVARRGPVMRDASQPPGSSWIDVARAWIGHAAAGLLVWARLAPLVGRRHARYLADMLEMFDTNDLESALRHAIPLSNELKAQLERLPPALGAMSPRKELALVPEETRATTALQLGNVYDVLRAKYRRAFEQLEARGEIEKAAFVLAELLVANEEAVSFLERHGRWKIAAEIAEARGLPPGLVIRQWFLAGEHARALRIARRTGAFADAVLRLEASHRGHAAALRVMWADALASAGSYAAAVDAVWPVEHARHVAAAWIDRAIDVGGIQGAKMLVRKARLQPDRFAEVRERVRDVLTQGDGDAQWLAQAMARELLAGEASDATRVLSRKVARALLSDALDGDEAKEAQQLGQTLIEMSGDAILRADVRASRGGNRRTVRALQMRAFALTQRGERRQFNEDMALATELMRLLTPIVPRPQEGNPTELGVLLGVFDGGGGQGNPASYLICESIVHTMSVHFENHRHAPGVYAEHFARTVEHAGSVLFNRAQYDRSLRGKGSTATVATWSGDALLIAHVGNSRAYVLRNGTLVPVTEDHSLLNQRIAEGKLTPKEIETFPHPNAIVRCLGTSKDVPVDLVRVEVRRGDTLLLCSDGLHGVLDASIIRQTLLDAAPRACCEALVAAARKAGGHDDISVAIACFGGADLRPPGNDPVLFAPVPRKSIDEIPLDPYPRRPTVPSPVHVVWPEAERGALHIYDLVELPDGKLLAGLGEIGAWLLSREGRVLTRFAQPTHRIVLSDHGDRAILIAPRGEVRRLAQLDISTRRVRAWCDARIDEHAPDFDGAIWYVSHGGTLFAIDALSTGWEHIWSVHEEGRDVAAIRRDPSSLSVGWKYTGDSIMHEVWVFDASSHALRQRQPFKLDPTTLHLEMASTGMAVSWQQDDKSTDISTLITEFKRTGAERWHLPFTTRDTAHPPHIAEGTVAFPAADGDGQTTHFYEPSSSREIATLRVDRSGADPHIPLGIRTRDRRALVFDPHGSAVIVSLTTGRILRHIRISG